MRWCLHKDSPGIDITTFSDGAKSVFLCEFCGGYRIEYRDWCYL